MKTDNLNRVPIEISAQVSQALNTLSSQLPKNIKAIYLYGSAVDGGLKPNSDIDLFVIVNQSLDEIAQQSVLKSMLAVSSLMKDDSPFRPLEVTVVSYSEIKPWHFPPKREIQFGEWLRQDIISGIFESSKEDPDLAILLTKIQKNSLTLFGPDALDILDPIPKKHFTLALSKTLDLWNSKEDLYGDELHITLTVARIWYSALTGDIAPKDVAIEWLLPKVPSKYQELLLEARDAYLGINKVRFETKTTLIMDFISHAKSQIGSILKETASN